jgi:hypothetical protein
MVRRTLKGKPCSMRTWERRGVSWVCGLILQLPILQHPLPWDRVHLKIRSAPPLAIKQTISSNFFTISAICLLISSRARPVGDSTSFLFECELHFHGFVIGKAYRFEMERIQQESGCNEVEWRSRCHPDYLDKKSAKVSFSRAKAQKMNSWAKTSRVSSKSKESLTEWQKSEMECFVQLSSNAPRWGNAEANGNLMFATS